ncbi:DUF433 domain-containing protein [Flavobacterium sandaracinum]|uniref:DUF433 domain-containing protein n=1 Tax=Flavobacterium sandaracinum TaxID=2541733 RepID=A0A4R5D3Q4_9FLAO|nr:DUF433 domain-containing protein [Flavobacterium sandaracinum]TDE05824.1 DUF433 domain-containing protein [Flavobacterium sandaracinum]
MFENQLQLGNGIFTTQEIAQILRVPYHKVNKWITKYWDGDLGKCYEQQYSWSVGNTRAVGFHTLIEFYVMMQFAEAGVKTREVLKAHKELSQFYQTHFPFANKEVLDNINTDKSKIYLRLNGDTISLDGSKQFNLDIIKLFFKNLDFDNEMLASRFWPLGKEHKIVCDPHRKFGQPILDGTNIQSEAIYRMYLAEEPISFIATLYEISEVEVKDAILFHKKAA